MSDVTRILKAVELGDPLAAEELLPLVYDELRELAARKMANEMPGQTLQPTALVHEAWLRLGGEQQPHWQRRAHFFGAAAEAMRRILVDRARRRQRARHGGELERVDLDAIDVAAPEADAQLVGVSEALDELTAEDPLEAQVVKLRFFMGMTTDEVAGALGISEKSVRRYWAHAKAWLLSRIRADL